MRCGRRGRHDMGSKLILLAAAIALSAADAAEVRVARNKVFAEGSSLILHALP